MYAMDQQHRSSTPKEKSSANLTGIPTQMKQNLESRSGLSFDDVRVHYHSAEPAKIGALAYTRGTQVHIGPGQERHLLHELGHVIQQKRGLVRPTTWINGLPVNDSPELERSAIHCVNEPIVQNGKDGIALETHLAPNTDQHVLQMMTDDELNILLGWFIWKYKMEDPSIVDANNEEELELLAEEDESGTHGHELVEILYKFYENTSKDKEKPFDQFLDDVRYHSAQRIIRAHMNKAQGKPPTVAIVFGDKAFITAKALQKRGFAVYSTALETVTDQQDSEGKFTKRVEKMFQRNGDGLLHLYQGIKLTENGELEISENPEENEQTDTSVDHNSPNTINGPDQFVTDIDSLSKRQKQNGLCVFDHPYTHGTYIQASDSVHKLCRDFFAFAKKQELGRAQITVRAINAGIDSGKEIKSTLGAYELVHPGFLIYRIQRSSAKMHLKTSDQSTIPDIVPTEQSLVLKYVNLGVMFPRVCQYAQLAYNGELQENFWTLIGEDISALLQSRYCPIDLLGYELSSDNTDSILEFLERFWHALSEGELCSELEQTGATIMEAHPSFKIDDEHSDV